MAKMPNPKGTRLSFTFHFFFQKGLIQNCSKNKSFTLKIYNIGQIRTKVLSQRG